MFKFLRKTETAETAEITETPAVVICPETGLPIGEPGSTERVLWIFAMNDLEDAEERGI